MGTIGRYFLKKTVGDGGYGVAWHASEETGEDLCVKVFKFLDSNAKESYDDETEVLVKKLSHPNIIRYLAAGTGQYVVKKKDMGEKLFITSEYAPNGDLFDYI